MTLPNFSVIGGTKSGTTALYWYLNDHPQIYMGQRHHIGYFAYAEGDDGRPLYGDPELHTWSVTTQEQYEEVFSDPEDAQAIGDLSPIYLESPHAARQMHELLPHARIVCSLRHPVDRAYSDYLMYLRKRSRRLDPAKDLTDNAEWTRPDSHWMMLGRYHEQLSRYFDLFPRDRIHVLLAEHLRKSPKDTVRGVYRFLEVDPYFVPNFETPHNVGGVPSSMMLEKVLTNHTLRTTLKPLLPESIANRLRKLRTSNMERAPQLPAELRRSMTEHLEEEIRKTGELVGVDLTHWLS